tara:strand:+ start:2515 stop:4674 length:2160 start_codon:yes stop_codon:yes gene_type:complete
MNVRDIDFSEEFLVYASSAGIVEYDFQNNKHKTISFDDGISFGRIEKIHIDSMGNYWIMSSNKIQIWSTESNSLIQEFDLDIQDITDILNVNNAVYISAKIDEVWGLIEFIILDKKIYFRDFYGRNDIDLISKISYHNNTIYILTDKEIISGNPYQEHITYWDNPFNNVFDRIIDFSNTETSTILLTENAIIDYKLNGSTKTLLDSFPESEKIKKLIISNSKIYAISDSTLLRIQNNKAERIFTDNALTLNQIFKNGENIWIATDFGLIAYIDEEFRSYLFNQPFIGNPHIVHLNDLGDLMLANNKGISVEGWSNYSSIPLPKKIDSNLSIEPLDISFGDEILKSIFVNNTLFLGMSNSTYAGAVSLNFNHSKFTLNNIFLPMPSQINDSLSYGIVDMFLDQEKNLWSSTTNENYPVSVFSNSQARHFDKNEAKASTIKSSGSITIDNYGRIWMVSNSGLLMYTFSGSALNPSSEDWFNELVIAGINRKVLSIAVSKKNKLWILTDYGLIYKELRASNEEPVAKTGPISSGNNIVPYFSNIPFDESSSIKLDSFDNIWITTKSRGLYVLDSKGDYWPSVDGINIDNSKLLSNTINDIAFNDEKGLAIIATDIGVSRFKIPFVNEIRSIDQVQIFPSPFRIPSKHPLVIDRIPERSTIQILTLDGSIIRTLKEENFNSYQATWYGNDRNGNLVSSGVYLLLIISKKHRTSTFQKVAVIRE